MAFHQRQMKPKYDPYYNDPDEYAQNYRAPTSSMRREVDIPEDVCDYLIFFKRAIIERDVPKIHQFYEYGFNDLTEKYYKEKFWPTEEEVAEIVGKDPPYFIFLYRELYYRYYYGRISRGPNLRIRDESYQNYNDLFMFILDPQNGAPVQLDLPNRWLWDIIDEFVYQFQSFCQFKSNPGKRSQEDMEFLAEFEASTWNMYPVFNILYTIISKSQINVQLEALNEGKDPRPLVDEFGRSPMYFRLGYFAIIGLMRVHILLGDYKEALRTIQHLNFDPKGLYNSVPSCLVTLHYYVGFCHMMMRRYGEAVRIFVNALLFIQRTRNNNQHQQAKSWQYDVISSELKTKEVSGLKVSKTNDQLNHLLGICLVLQPQRIDEGIHSQLNEKHGDRMNRMRKGELKEFEEAFTMGCPKFLAPNLPTDARENVSKAPLLHQSKIFMSEIREQISIPLLRGYLKLYSSITITKLAGFMNVEEEVLVGNLLSFKHKLYNLSKEGEGTDEDMAVDLDFYVDKDMIHIADTKVGRRHGEYFIRHITKLMELNRNLNKLEMTGRSLGGGVGKGHHQHRVGGHHHQRVGGHHPQPTTRGGGYQQRRNDRH